MSPRSAVPTLLAAACVLALGSDALAAAPATEGLAPILTSITQMARPQRSLDSFAKSNTKQACYNRKTEPYIGVVDAHFHPRPFGGPAMAPAQIIDMFDRTGVRFVNYFGIGQSLDMASSCTYYLDCPGTTALPSIKNDFVNAQEAKVTPHPNVNIVLSMTFIDLAHPEPAVEMIKLYDREFPGMFKWAGELNVEKQALLKNLHEPATLASIDAWEPFMQVLRERNMPVTLHSDLGNDAEPTKFVPLMQHILQKYPQNKIVWAHMGLSKELTKMPAAQHIAIMKKALDSYPNLMLDISWDVLYNAYHEYGAEFVAFFNQYPTRILNGSDFVAAGNKTVDDYVRELEITSRVNRAINDEAFRRIALGQNYFDLMDLPYKAPEVCR